MRFEVLVELRPEVLDAQGRAIQEALYRLGHPLQNVRLSRRYLLEFGDDTVDPEGEARRIAAEVLANPVAETFSLTRLGS